MVRQATADRGQGLHLDAGLGRGLRARRHDQRGARLVRGDLDLTLESGIGWQSGISSAVRLAAMIPAISAAARTLPFFASPASAQRQRFGRHAHAALGHRLARGDRLAADIDHARAALAVEMGEFAFAMLISP